MLHKLLLEWQDDVVQQQQDLQDDEDMCHHGPLRHEEEKVRIGDNEYILYLIRHGEALHNVLEKEAKQQALQQALKDGWSADQEETLQRMEEARLDVLNNNELQDCALSFRGRKEALQAKEVVSNLATGRLMLPPPAEILVSPLRRALQTADLVFPESNDIHVREELQERQTLKACDTRSPSVVLSKSPEFRRFCMKRLQRSSFQRHLSEHHADSDDASDKTNHEDYETSEETSKDDTQHKTASATVAGFDKHVIEEKHMLRERTKQLFGLIQESQSNCLAIVGHKGYLRELERGPLGLKDATEFKNCEVRVYKIQLANKTTTIPGDNNNNNNCCCSSLPELGKVERLV